MPPAAAFMPTPAWAPAVAIRRARAGGAARVRRAAAGITGAVGAGCAAAGAPRARAVAALVFGDVMTVETDGATLVGISAVRLFSGASLRAAVAAAVRGDSSGYGCGLAWFRRVFTFPCAAPCTAPLGNLLLL